MRKFISVIVCIILVLSFTTLLSADDAIVMPYSDTSTLDSSLIYYQYSWTPEAHNYKQGQDTYALISGNTVSITYACASAPIGGSIQIGLWDVDKNSYYKSVSISDASAHTHNFHITQTRNLKLRITNNSNSAVNVSGTYQVFTLGATPTLAISLPVSLYHQEMSNWCWATCVQMSAEYLVGYKSSQSDIVKAAKGAVINEGGTDTDYNKGMIYATNGLYSTSRIQNSIPQNDIMSILKTKTPIIIGFQLLGDNNYHGNVLVGMSSDMEIIKTNDPAASTTGATDGMIKFYRYSDITDSRSYRRYYSTTKIIQGS